MIYTRATWIAGALFVLCGLPLLVIEDVWWGHFWGGLAVLWLGAFAPGDGPRRRGDGTGQDKLFGHSPRRSAAHLLGRRGPAGLHRLGRHHKRLLAMVLQGVARATPLVSIVSQDDAHVFRVPIPCRSQLLQ